MKCFNITAFKINSPKQVNKESINQQQTLSGGIMLINMFEAWDASLSAWKSQGRSESVCRSLLTVPRVRWWKGSSISRIFSTKKSLGHFPRFVFIFKLLFQDDLKRSFSYFAIPYLKNPNKFQLQGMESAIPSISGEYIKVWAHVYDQRGKGGLMCFSVSSLLRSVATGRADSQRGLGGVKNQIKWAEWKKREVYECACMPHVTKKQNLNDLTFWKNWTLLNPYFPSVCCIHMRGKSTGRAFHGWILSVITLNTPHNTNTINRMPRLKNTHRITNYITLI